MQRLAIIVPYRNREVHLNTFVPHMRAYFSRDKADQEIPYSVFIIEQEHGLPFNRGALKNIGFLLAAEHCDYVCFHDVDYLPIWADYSPVAAPTPIVWHGAELRPIALGRSNHVTRHDLNSFYGGALLIPNEQFRRINGYSNDYWGWGYEDTDIKFRFDAEGIKMDRRRGTFRALDHDNEGFKIDGQPSAISLVNKSIFETWWSTGVKPIRDGLSTIDFQVMRRQSIPDQYPERAAEWSMITVRIKGEPSREQREALASAQVKKPMQRAGRKQHRYA